MRIDATHVYFTDATSGVVDRVPIGGGSVTTLTTTGVPGVGRLAIDATTAYFGSRGNTSAAILSVPLTASGGMPAQVLTNLPSLAGIHTDGVDLWFAEPSGSGSAGTGQIHRATVAGTSDSTLASMQNGPGCIVVDSTSVYWIDTGGGMISKTAR
jgi:hypothetical protein